MIDVSLLFLILCFRKKVIKPANKQEKMLRLSTEKTNQNLMKPTYLQNIKQYSELIQHFQKKQNTTAWLRAGVFVAIIAVVFAFNFALWTKAVISFILIGVFIFFIQRSFFLQKQITYHKNLKLLNENELKALEHDYSVFDAGTTFKDNKHDYAFDLDFFGKGSIYQYLCRSYLIGGKHRLSQKLKKPLQQKQQIEQMQQTIAELAGKTNWRQHFLAYSMQIEREQEAETKLMNWLKQRKDEPKIHFADKFIFKILPLVFFISFAGSFLLAAFNMVSFSLMVFVVLSEFAVMGLFVKRINQYHQQVGKLANIFDHFTVLFRWFENEPFEAEYLNQLKAKLIHQSASAHQTLNQLSLIARAFDQRLNFIMAIFGNLMAYWDMIHAIRLEKWLKANSKQMPEWFGVLFEIEALISLANYAQNHQHTAIFPQIYDDKKYVKFENLKHILINPQKVVGNNIEMLGNKQIAVITGANMAGKSTFLRTVGTSMVLAQMGLPVLAHKAEVSAFRLFTSIRTSDSLQDNESYFYAELIRLKQIIDELKTGAPVFVIVDEMLRGTNSIDKHKGSEGFIRRLHQLNAFALVATHDVALGVLENEFPAAVKNLKFEIQIINDQLIFDYKLQKGVSQNMNAHFLMRKMEIIKHD